jgi:hypothetical protein
MCLTLYSMAAAGYFDQEYIESVFMNYIGQTDFLALTMISNKQDFIKDISEITSHGTTPHLDQLAFIAQSCAILRKTDYTSVLI